MNRLILATFALRNIKSTFVLPKTSTGQSRYNFSRKIVPGQFYCSSASSTVEENDASVVEDNNVERGDSNNANEITGSTNRENITDRLFRLSAQSPEEFIPTDSMEITEQKRWERYSQCFPDQNHQSNNIKQRFDQFQSDRFSHPHRGANYNNQSQRQPYRQSGRYSDSNYDSGRNYRSNQYEDDDFNDFPQQSYHKPNNRRFDNDRMPYSLNTKFANENSRGRNISRGIVNDEEEEDSSARIDYNKMKRDYDLDDDVFSEEPRQRSQMRFSDQDNQAAIKDAYMKRFKIDDSGSKREFHTQAALSNLQRAKSQDILASDNLNNSPWGRDHKITKLDQLRTRRASDAQVDCELQLKNDPLVADGDNPEVFGCLRTSKSKSVTSLGGTHFSMEASSADNIYSLEEEDDIVFRPEARMSMKKLEKQIKELLTQKKLTDALDLFTKSVSDGGFRYTLKELAYVYRIIIAECAKHGHVKMAHKLYIRMMKRRLYVLPGVYTSLFNGCANSPWYAEQNIELMDRLRQQMAEKGYSPNDINYNAMIKGYGRCGSIEKAFAVVDEMVERKDKSVIPTTDTFNFLLQACITDKTNGFRNALFTWNEMKARKIRPQIHSYHLLLKATRECGISIPQEIEKEIRKKNEKLQTVRALLVESNQNELLSQTRSTFDPDVEKSKYLVSGSLSENNLSRIKTTLEIINCKRTPDIEFLPAAQSKHPTIAALSDADVEVIERLRYPHYRLLMLGGLRGILQQMRSDKVKPNIKIIQELLLLVRHEEAVDVMQLLNNYKVKPDIQLYNVLIKKLSKSNHPEEARRVLQLINDHRLNPDIYTWSALALGCRTWQSAKQLLADMEISKITPNNVIMASLLSQACRNCDPYFVVMIMNEITRRELPTTPKLLEIIENFRNNMKTAVLQAEKKEPVTVPRMASVMKFNQDQFLEDFRIFKLQYDRWLRAVGVESEPEDPWAEDFASRFPRRENDFHVE
ncbi:unnamed protein product [Allacma fusca]|uniref:PROP1-like PPR domain-containing protein n=1 Tax=Allacma fusca TaxID=39272 RepID=A0A8J2L9W4_9HEXA|nr:unnamed protein product [Allacma fusca]